jgi:hypothetical protein
MEIRPGWPEITEGRATSRDRIRAVISILGHSRLPVQSLRQADASHEIRETRIGAQAVEVRLRQLSDTSGAFLIPFLKPLKSRVSIPKPRVDDSDVDGNDVLFFRERFKLFEDL